MKVVIFGGIQKPIEDLMLEDITGTPTLYSYYLRTEMAKLGIDTIPCQCNSMYDSEEKFNDIKIPDGDCILSPSNKDSHFEHRNTYYIAEALLRNTNKSFITYNCPSTLNTWIPNLKIYIEQYFYDKTNLLKQFKSQRERPYFQSSYLWEFHHDISGCIEKFRIERLSL